jgi:hypothetical protein
VSARDSSFGFVIFASAIVAETQAGGLTGRRCRADRAEMLAPPGRGIRGNSHMIMQDKNNLQIADLILRWIEDRVSTPSGVKR